MKTLTLTFRTDYPEALYDFFKKRETESKIGYDGLCKDFKIGTDTPIAIEPSEQADVEICSDSPCAYCTESGNGCCDECGVQNQKYYFRGRKLSAV